MNGVGAYAAVSIFSGDDASLTSPPIPPPLKHDVIIVFEYSEPSPIAGYFLESELMQGSTCSSALSLNAKCSANKALNDSNSTLCDDGYNWRKYGQKFVKGSEFPRSYYKCSHAKCEVKKIFERSHTGQIIEMVYKGTHDHPKPHSNHRFTASTLSSIQEENEDKVISLPGRSSTSGRVHYFETYETSMPSPKRAKDDNMDGSLPQLDITTDKVEDDSNSKRSRSDLGTLDITPVVKPIRGSRVVVQTIGEVDIMDDGYRWRKYGQKVVRGNSNPRSYYKCTSAECVVRKHVERASHDPKAVITTYEGKHNHDIPIPKNNSHEIKPNDAICLDLLVGNKFVFPIPVLTKFSGWHAMV